MLEALIQQLQAGNCVVGLEADFGDQVDDDEGLDVFELKDAPHGLVDFLDAVGVAVAVFALHECEAEGDDEVCPAPKGKVAVELEQAGFSGCAGRAEPFVCEVLRVEGKEDGVGKELAGCEAHGLGGRGVCEVLLRQESEGPACHCQYLLASAWDEQLTVYSNVLRCAEEDQRKPPPREGPYAGVRLASCGQYPVDVLA